MVGLVRRIVAPLTITILTSWNHPATARPRLDQSHLNELERYDVLSFADPFHNGLDRGKAIGVIDATTEEVFRVATDYARYQEFMPRISRSVVVRRTGLPGEAEVQISAELPWPAGTSWVEAHYQAERLPGEIYRVRFDMVRGTLRHYLGSLYIEPWAPSKSAITYELVAEPNVLAPHSALNRGVRRTVFKFVHALRQRINELHRLGYLHPVGQPTSTTAQVPPVPLAPCALKAGR
jgi:hypothetical protein